MWCAYRMLCNPVLWVPYDSIVHGGRGYLRKLTIRLPTPPTISKTIVSINTISCMWILLSVLWMFQLEFFKNSRFWPFYSDFKIKSSEDSCKNNTFIILSKMDFKHSKRHIILLRMQLVLGGYDYYVARNCNVSVQNVRSCLEICDCNNFQLIIW